MSVALAAVPVSAIGPVAAGAVVVLLFVEVAVTSCVMVQLWPGGRVPALKPTEVPPFTPPVRVAVPAPVHATLPAAALVRVPVYASLIETPVRLPGLPAAAETVIVIVEVWPLPMDARLKLFVAVGGANTFSVAEVGAALLPLFVCSAPAAMVFT